MGESAGTVVLLGDYDLEYFREVSIKSGLQSEGFRVVECRYREKPLFVGVRKALLLPYFYLRILARMARIARTESSVDAVVVTKFNVLVLPLAAVIARLLGATLVYDLFVSLYRTGEMRDYPTWKVWLVYRLEYLSLRLPAYLLTETAAFERLYADLYSLDRERLVGVPVGANADHFYPHDGEEFDRFTVAYWGNFLPHHGLETVVGAVDRLRDADVRFVFVGEGPAKADVVDRVEALGVENVEFRGRVPWAELSGVAAGADAALGIFADDPRSRASVTNKVTEGVAAGTAVVTMDAPGVREWFTDGEDVVLVPPEDPAALADAIRRLRDDPERRAAIASAGRRSYERSFSVERIGELLVEGLALGR
jgi:glycosyltransferase involved in cell wall biosynthesis